MELTADGGATWIDIGAAAYNGALNTSTTAPIGAGHRAFVNRMTGWPSFAPVTLNLGTAYAGKDVRIRFRIGADESTGAPGWDIGNIAISGLLKTPFASFVPQAATCPAK